MSQGIETRLNILTYTETWIVYRDDTVLNLLRAIPNFSVTVVKEYTEKVIALRMLGVEKDIMGFEFLI